MLDSTTSLLHSDLGHTIHLEEAYLYFTSSLCRVLRLLPLNSRTLKNVGLLADTLC